MPTLRDALVALRRLDVGPEEVEISEDYYNFIIQKAREIVAEEVGDEELTDNNLW